MEHIVEPNDNFMFDKLTLLHPSGIQGGAYFTRLMYSGKPLYIQTPQSKSRQGFVKTGKKYHCDLMFDHNAESMINWIERLEEKCQDLLLSKNNDWFQNSLDKNDLENAFNTTLRIFKSGKFYLMRTNIKNNTDNSPVIRLFDERQTPLVFDDIKDDSNMVSIIEIQGIKFTSRNFQIEIELKQVMVMDKEPLFDSCLIKTRKSDYLETPLISKLNNQDDDSKTTDKMQIIPFLDKTEIITALLTETTEEKEPVKIQTTSYVSDEVFVETSEPSIQNVHDTNIISDTSTIPDTDDTKTQEELKDVVPDIHVINKREHDNDIKEIQLIVADDLETISLKKPNQVYFELYKKAREKAKLAKRNVIVAYLEAKKIKKTYMIDNLNDSDSDFDAEIEEVSESELEGL